MTASRRPPIEVPIAVWQLLLPLEVAERRQVVEAIVEDMPSDRQEAERDNLLKGLPRRPTNARGRPETIRLADHDGVTVHHTFVGLVRVTLFEMGAPAVPGCQVTMETSASRRSSAQWAIEYKGFGTRRRTEIRTTLRAAFSVDEGQRKRVFGYVPAAITRVFELRSGRLRPLDLIDIARPPKQAATMGAPGVETIHGSEPLPAQELGHYPLAGDTSGDISTYTHEFERAQDVSASLGGVLKGVSLRATAAVGVTASLKLTMKLTGGRDYRLHSSAEGLGIVWSVS
jgi:hypothetical protein